jgi:hypothetical protein
MHTKNDMSVYKMKVWHPKQAQTTYDKMGKGKSL